MATFRIITDSGNDLTPQMIEDYGLIVIPLPILMDGEPYRDMFETEEQVKDFYHLIRDEGKVATTSCISMEDFDAAARTVLDAGEDLLFLGFSSGLSSSTPTVLRYIETKIKPDYPDRTIETIDTLCVSGGLALLFTYVNRLQGEGKDIDEIASWVRENRLHFGHQFTTDDLMYLHRGGRVNRASAIAGTALGIKPVLHVDDEGRLTMVDKAKGRRKSMRSLVDRAGSTTAETLGEQTVYINHGDCIDEAKVMGQMLAEQFGTTDITYLYCTPVIAAHSGPGTLSVFYFTEGQR